MTRPAKAPRRSGAGHRARADTRGAKTAAATPAELSPFARVQALVKRIPQGRVATYGQLSKLIGERLTPVGIGWAIRAAPEGSIPWHRVVNARGGISTDREHEGLQRAMLESEGVAFGRDGCIDLARFAWRPRSARGLQALEVM